MPDPITLRVWRYAPEGMTVLDALVEIQRGQDPTLAFRYSCRVGMCGSCAVVINGRERWACRTLLASLKADTVTGVFVPKEGEEALALIVRNAKERRQIDAAIECIGCGMCLSACTMVGWDEKFAGPAALNRAFTLQVDSRDGAGAGRWPLLLSEDALLRCHGQANCTEVCPMELSPTDSILKLRRRSIFQLVKSAHRLDTSNACVLA